MKRQYWAIALPIAHTETAGELIRTELNTSTHILVAANPQHCTNDGELFKHFNLQLYEYNTEKIVI
jgi:hypothetical protein